MSDAPERLLYDSHMHTPLCNHATGETTEYAQAGYDANLRGIIFTCHNPLPARFGTSHRMSEAQWPEYLSDVEHARKVWEGKLDVHLGLECDWMPGFGIEEYVRDQVKWEPFDHLLGSIHPQSQGYKQLYLTDGPVAFQKTYFEHIAQTAELGLFDTVSHPDLVKNETVADWQLDRIWDDICKCLDRVASAGTAMELNTSGWNKKLPEQNPSEQILRAMAERNIPVVLGSDSHVPERVGDRFGLALHMLADAGFTHVSYFLQRKRHELAISDALASLPETAQTRD